MSPPPTFPDQDWYRQRTSFHLEDVAQVDLRQAEKGTFLSRADRTRSVSVAHGKIPHHALAILVEWC
ncbi:hypothetical protein JMJ78_0000931 [Colletotrichum scovillei]|nr:hypothetical protein JMJ78_0000931 [Colletotrichum scovillei]